MFAVDRWVEKRPEWFDQPRIDIEDGHEGWGQLIDNAFRSAEQILSDYRGASFRIVQVKEKLGALTIYFRQEGLPTEVSDRLSEIMQAARKQSPRSANRSSTSRKLRANRRYSQIAC
jgi:hypothetical protein